MDLNLAFTGVMALVAVLGLVGGVIGFVRGTRAEGKAEQAQRDATAAQTRAAAALERANEIAEASAPERIVRWSDPVQISGVSSTDRVYRIENIGTVPASAAHLEKLRGLVHVRETGTRDVEPQQGLTFLGVAMGGEFPAVRVHWIDPDGASRSTDLSV